MTADTAPVAHEVAAGNSSAADNPDSATPPSGRGVGIAIETLLLLLSPLLGSLFMGGQRMVAISMIDPDFYSAYAEHGPDLIQRYGDTDYYFARQGFVLPARISYLLFGAGPGFLVLRYVFALLAVVPAYLLLRRLYGRLAGATAVAVILTSQVVLLSWGTDYPDSAAVAYLAAGTACLFMPQRSSLAQGAGRLSRLGWVVAAGVTLTLSVHSQTWAAPLVAAIAFSYLLAYGTADIGLATAPHPARRTAWLQGLLHAVVLAACFVVVTIGLIVAAKVFFGSGNIIKPTIRAGEHFREPAQLALWHSKTWRWIINDPYLFVLPSVVGGWLLLTAARWRTGERPGWSERGIVLATALQGGAYLAGQFVGQVAVLEFFLYSSMLWPGVCLTTTFLVIRLCGLLPRHRLTSRALLALPLALVLATPWAFRPWSPGLEFDMAPNGLLLVIVIVAVVAIAALWRSRVVGAVAAAGVLACAQALVVGVPIHRPLVTGQVNLPSPPFGSVMNRDDGALLERYEAVARIPGLVPPADGVGNDDLLTWWNGNSELLNISAAEYLWHRNSLRSTMPELSADSVATLEQRQPEDVVLLSETGAEFAAAVASLRAAGFDPHVVRTETLRQGSVAIHVQVIGMEGYGQ